MTTLNLQSFNGKHFHDVYVFIMQQQEIAFKVILPRRKDLNCRNFHLATSIEFGCAAYAAYLLNEVSTDFAYSVPSAYKPQSFEYRIETADAEKLADIIFILLCSYNENFANDNDSDFYLEAAQYYARATGDDVTRDEPGAGLLAVARVHFVLALSAQVKN